MTQGAKNETYEFINGLRGIAALQVVILHYCAAFLPAFARAGVPSHYQWEERLSHSLVFFLADGYMAVYLFFAMSGFVLAGAFMRSRSSIAAQAAKRFVRLYIPVTTSVLFAALFLHSSPDSSTNAVSFSHSSWLQGLSMPPMRGAELVKDTFFTPIFAGYGASSLVEQLGITKLLPALHPGSHATNPPLWTLHLEFWGSLAVLALCAAFRLRQRFSRAVYVVALIVSGTSFLSLFVIGIGLYLLRARIAAIAEHSRFFGPALVLVGLVLSFAPVDKQLGAMLQMLAPLPIMRAIDGFQFQCQLSALAIFVGILCWKGGQRATSTRPVLWFGRVSFGLYLTHFAVLMTIGCEIFSALAPYSYGCACFASVTIGGAMSLAIAAAFEHFVDRPSIQLSRVVARQWLSRATGTTQR